MKDAWMIVGLGNPGPQYAFTRHNIGFLLLDWIAGSASDGWNSEHKGLLKKVDWDGHKVFFLKPQTFMNLSGTSVQPCAHFYKIPLERIVVVHDEVDLPFEKLKFQKNRGHGGHNGVRDITEKMGSADYCRLRLGIGRPAHPQMAMTDHVLGPFNSEEKPKLEEFFKQSLSGLQYLIKNGLDRTTTEYNR